MATMVTLPQARSPLGHAMFNGQRVPVEIDQEWMRAFTNLVARAGGVSGTEGVAATATAALQLAEGLRLGAFSQRPQQLSIRAGANMTVTRDAMGVVLSAVVPSADDAQNVLANRVFRA